MFDKDMKIAGYDEVLYQAMQGEGDQAGRTH